MCPVCFFLFLSALSPLSRCRPSRESWKDIYSVNHFLDFVTDIYTCSGPCSGVFTSTFGIPTWPALGSQTTTLKIPRLIDCLLCLCLSCTSDTILILNNNNYQSIFTSWPIVYYLCWLKQVLVSSCPWLSTQNWKTADHKLMQVDSNTSMCYGEPEVITVWRHFDRESESFSKTHSVRSSRMWFNFSFCLQWFDSASQLSRYPAQKNLSTNAGDSCKTTFGIPTWPALGSQK